MHVCAHAPIACTRASDTPRRIRREASYLLSLLLLILLLTPAAAPRGIKFGLFGGVALFGVIFYASGIPRVQRDVLQKVPFIGGHFVHTIPASDNVGCLPLPSPLLPPLPSLPLSLPVPRSVPGDINDDVTANTACFS